MPIAVQRLRSIRAPSIESLATRIRRPGPELTPEEQAQRSTLETARRALRDAERRHAAAVRAARRTLRRAQRAHEHGVRAARKELQRAERAAGTAVARAERRQVVVTSTRELGRYGALKLYEDRIDTGYEIVRLAPGFRAFVGPLPVLARTGPDAGIPERIVDARGRSRSRRALRSDRMYLALEGAGARLLVEIRDEEEARRFAELVNVAVLNVERLLRAREDAGAEAEREVASVRRESAGPVERAREKLESVAGDRDAVEAAAQALAAAEADTHEIELAREELRTAERAAAADQSTLL